jgi:hypothetical protein
MLSGRAQVRGSPQIVKTHGSDPAQIEQDDSLELVSVSPISPVHLSEISTRRRMTTIEEGHLFGTQELNLLKQPDVNCLCQELVLSWTQGRDPSEDDPDLGSLLQTTQPLDNAAGDLTGRQVNHLEEIPMT